MRENRETMKEYISIRAKALITPIMNKYTAYKEKMEAIQTFSYYWDKAAELHHLPRNQEDYRAFFTDQITAMLRAFPEDAFDSKQMHLAKIELTENLIISMRTTVTQDQEKREAKIQKTIAMFHQNESVLETDDLLHKPNRIHVMNEPEQLTEHILFSNEAIDNVSSQTSLASLLERADSEYQMSSNKKAAEPPRHKHSVIIPVSPGK